MSAYSLGRGKNHVYPISIGHYEGLTPAISPANQMLLGHHREQRRQFLDWLQRRSVSGAILIAGARGVGKSTFVDTCLREYDDHVHARLAPLASARGYEVLIPLLATYMLRILVLPIAGAAMLIVAAEALKHTDTQGFIWPFVVAAAALALSPTWWFCRSRWLTTQALRTTWWTPKNTKQADQVSPTVTWKRSQLMAGVLGLLLVFLGLAPFFPPRAFSLLAVTSAVFALGSLGAAYREWVSFGTSVSPGLSPTFLEQVSGDLFPVLRVRVNLGFENLETAAVLRAMLSTLVGTHSDVLLHPWSSTALYRRLTVGLAVFLLTAFLFPLEQYAEQHWRIVDELGDFVPSFWNARLISIQQDDEAPYRCLTSLFPSEPGVIRIRYVDVALWTAVWALWRSMLGPISNRYHHLESRRMNEVLERIDSSMRRTNSSEHGLTLHALDQLVARAKSKDETILESSKLDARQVELNVVTCLERLARPMPTQIRWVNALLVPSADVVFVFDELDKVGSRGGIAENGRHANPSGGYFSSDRNRDVHRLLSDMKNLVASVSARFVFIGSRDLDDEWLADRTARSPLLSTVFDDALYIPSLLHTSSGPDDPNPPCRHFEHVPKATGAPILDNVAHFVAVNKRSSRLRRRLSTFTSKRLPLTWATSELKPRDRRGKHETDLENWYRYLVVASRGNLKRLQDLYASSVAAGSEDAVRNQALLFTYDKRYMNQLHREIFDRVAPLIAYRNEDKVLQSAFYLSEYLFKFHRRAFHWNDLELLEEIVDVHRAPDVREFFGQMVKKWSQSYLCTIDFGLYKYRFDSAIAAELRYASRISEFAMATFNFALDETRLLKREYERRLQSTKERKDSEFAARIALAKIYDFEEDYQRARIHYAGAIQALDRSLQEQHGSAVLSLVGVAGTELVVERSSQEALQVRAQINWIVPRVFNKLRLGLTYEKTGDYIDAALHYTNAQTLSQAALSALLSAPVQPPTLHLHEDIANDWLETLKMMQLFLQPVLACAWAAEKSRSPSSGALIMKGLGKRARVILDGPHAAAHSWDFRMTVSDIYQSIGQFFTLRGAGCQREASKYLRQAGELLVCGNEARIKDDSGQCLGFLTPKAARRLANLLFLLADNALAQAKPGDELTVPSASDATKLLKAIREVRSDWQCGTGQDKDLLGLLDDRHTSHLARYLVLSRAAIELLHQAGFDETAFWELLNRIDVITGVFWVRQIMSSRTDAQSIPYHDESLAKDLYRVTLDDPLMAPYLSSPGDHDADDTNTTHRRAARRAKSRLLITLRPTDEDTKDAHEWLRLDLQTSHYPVFIALAGARDLLRHLVAVDSGSDLSVYQELLRDFVDLNATYDSVIHFSHFSFGSTIALWCLGSKEEERKPVEAVSSSEKNAPRWLDSATLARLREDSLRALRKSIGVACGQRSFQEVISKVYYLEDGFSDRSLRTGLAFQLFALPLSEALVKELEDQEEAYPHSSGG